MPTTHPVSAPLTDGRRLANEALFALAGGGMVTFITGVVVGLSAAGFLAVMQHGSARLLLAGSALLVSVALAFAINAWLVTPRRARSELAWLATLPFGFAHEGYIEALSTRNESAAVELVLHFAAPPRPDVLVATIEATGVDSRPSK